MKKKKNTAVLWFLAAIILLICPTRALGISPTVYGFPGASYWREEDQFAWARAMESAMDAVQGVGAGAGSGLGTGEIFYVDSNVTNAGDGSNWDNAVATLDEAFALCENDRGDVIHVAELHAEDWTTVDAADCDVRGVAIIGHGEGSLRPTFTFDHANGEFVLGAANCYVYNLAFLPSVDQVVHAIEVEADADGSVIDNCWFMDGETAADDEFIDAVQFTTASDNITIVNCKFESYTAAGANTGVDLTAGVVKDVVIAGNYFNGNYAEAPVYSDDIDLRMLVSWNDVTNSASNQFGIEFTANATGIIAYNVCNTTTNYEIDPGVMITHGNNSDATDLGAANLDHLMKTAVADGDNLETEVVDGTVLSNILTKTGDTSDYARATMSIEYLAETVAAILIDTATIDTQAELRTLLYGSDTAGGTASNQTSILAFLRTGTLDKLTGPADTYSILDILGSDGSTTTGAVAGSILGAIGTNEAAADTPFSSSTVESDADGSVLERAEWLQVEMAKVPKSDGAVSWNATARAAIEAEVDDSMETYKLDHLVQAADSDDPADSSIFAKLASKTSDWSTFSASTDSLEGIRDALDAMQGVGFRGTCNSNAVTTTVVCDDLAGFGNDYFNTGWSLTVLKNASAPGTLCEGQTIDITDYVSTTGTFTLNVAAAEAIDASDEIYVRRVEELNLNDPTMLGSAGTIRYVDSGTSGDGSGLTWENAYATLVLAEAACSAGDVIYIADGHDETVATGGILLNVANLTISGMGEGDAAPRFDCDADSDEITLDAAGITLKNIRMRPGATNLTSGIRIEDEALGCTLDNIAFIDGEAAGTDEFIDAISVDTSATDLTVRNCTYYSTGDGCGTFVNLDEATIASPTIENCTVYGGFSEAGIWGDTAVPTNVMIKNNVITNTTSAQLGIEFQGNATGWMIGNLVSTDAVATSYDPGRMSDVGNYWDDFDTYDTAAILWTTNEDGVNRWSATELAQMQAEATDAIEDDSLDKLIAADDSAGATAYPDSVAQDSILAYIMASDASPVVTGYDNTTDSLEAIADRDISILSYLVNGTPDKITAPASTYTILDILGSTGSDTTGAVAGSILGAIGTNEATGATPFSSSTVGEDADGSVLERAEFLQNKTDDVLAALGIDQAAANIFYVDSVAANGGDGTSWAQSEDTLKAAVDDATDDTSAIIIVASNHAENIGASTAMDCPGVKIIGLGVGESRPTLTFTATASALAHTVADVMYKNIIFVSGTADSTVCVSLDGSSDGAIFEDCEFRSTGAFEFLSCVTLATGADHVRFTRCKFNNATAGVGNATEAIQNTTGVTDGMTIEDCEFYGAWTAAAIFSDDADTDVTLRNNTVRNTSTGVHAVEFSAAALGTAAYNRMYGDTWGTIFDPGSLDCYENYGTDSTDESARLVPAASTVAGQYYTAVCTTTTAYAEDLFSVSAPMYVTNLVGLVTTNINGDGGNLKVWCDATTTAQDTDFSTAVAVEGDAAGTRWVFSNASPSVLTPCEAAAGGGTSMMEDWFCPTGMIEQTNTDVDCTGVIVWYLTWQCITDGTTVTAQ